MSHEKVSEWWEVWIYVPGQAPVRRERYGEAADFRIPREGYVTRAEALEAMNGNKFGKIVHVVRYRSR